MFKPKRLGGANNKEEIKNKRERMRHTDRSLWLERERERDELGREAKSFFVTVPPERKGEENDFKVQTFINEPTSLFFSFS